MALMMALLLKATLLLTVALVGSRLLRRSAAASRHRFWSVAFVALLALPALGLALPALYVPVPVSWQRASSTIVPAFPPAAAEASAVPAPITLVAAHANRREATLSSAAAPQRSHLDLRDAAIVALLGAWIGGTLTAFARLVLSLWRVGRLSSAADTLTDPAWTRAADELSARLGLRTAPRLLTGDVATPMAGGVWRPAVFLPRSAAAWASDRRDVVLAHEIAHLVERDVLRHAAARIAVALYWFHPLVWIAARQASAAREETCDAAVLALGTRPSAYAQVLLDLADLPCGPAPAAALPIVQRSLLETRLMAILNTDARTPARRLLTPAVALTVFAVSLGAAQLGSDRPMRRAVDTILPVAPPSSASPAMPTLPAPALSPFVSEQTRDSACRWDQGASFSGTMSTNESPTGRIVTRQIGTRGSDRIIQEDVGDLGLCMIAEGIGDRPRNDRPSDWATASPHVIMEVSRGTRVQRLEIDRRGGAARTVWRVGQTVRPLDAAGERWRDRLLAALDSTWEIATLRGEESSLRGDISSIRGEESTLRGQISSLNGEVSTMRGRQSSVRGQESTLRGDISSIEGQVSSLRGKISTEQGAISSLNATRYGADATERTQIADRVTRHNAEISRLERELADYHESARIAAVDQQIHALDADSKVAVIENQIRTFDLDGKVAVIEQKIRDLDVQGKVAEIERRIAALDADRRVDAIEKQRDEQLKQLRAAVDAIK